MEMDWEFLARGIQEIGSMVSNTLIDQYRQKEAEKRFLKRTEEILKLKEPYDIRENERIIARQKQILQDSIEAQKKLTRWDAQWQAEIAGSLNDFELLKRREKAAKSGDAVEQANIMALDNLINKAQTTGELDLNNPVIQSLPPYARMNYTRLGQERQNYMDEFNMKMAKAQKEIMYLMSILDQREDQAKRRQMLTDKDIAGLLRQTREALHEEKSALMNELTEAGIIDKKGNYKRGVAGIGGLWKNMPLINLETGKFNQEMVQELVSKYPQFLFRFQRISELTSELEGYRQKYSQEKDKEILSEENIQKAMKATGWDRSTVLQEWEKFKNK